MSTQTAERSAALETAAGQRTVTDFLSLLWTGRGTIARGAAIGLICATILAFVIPQKFAATSRIMGPENNASSALSLLTGGSPGTLAMYGDLLGMKSNAAMYVGLLQSRTVQDHIIDKFDLRRVYRKRKREDARKVLAKRSEIVLDKKSGLISITVLDRDPNRAAEIANAYVAELDKILSQVNTSSAHRERVFLEERLKAVKEDLDNAISSLAQFSSKNVTFDPQVQGKAVLESAAALQRQLMIGESELKAMQKMYAPQNVRLQSAQARVDELKRQLAEIGGLQDSGDPKVLSPSIRKLPLLGSEYANFYRRARIQEAVYETLTKQYELAKVQEVKETPTTKVVDVAVPPEKRAFPPRIQLIVLGLLLSLLLAAAKVILGDWWQRGDGADPLKRLLSQMRQSVQPR